MATSPSHRFGQIIGDLLESIMVYICRPVASEYGLYLDYRHPRSARGNQKEVKWIDINGNSHKLDIVMEENGSEETLGSPRVFVEIAWRRYTKHSKNKAQEISGAITPLVSKYKQYSPFYGAVLAGEFTNNSLNQLKSEGFEVLYFSYDDIKRSFACVGINMHWEEDTSDEDLQLKINQFDNLTQDQINMIGTYLISLKANEIEQFLQSLRNSLERRIESIRILSLYGTEIVFNNIQDACMYLSQADQINRSKPLQFYKFEIQIKYTNGDKYEMSFRETQAAITCLMQYLS